MRKGFILVCALCVITIGFSVLQTYKISSYSNIVKTSLIEETRLHLNEVFRYSEHMKNFANQPDSTIQLNFSAEGMPIRMKFVSAELDEAAVALQNSVVYNNDIDVSDMTKKIDIMADTLKEYSTYEEDNVPEELLNKMRRQSEYLKKIKDSISKDKLSLSNIGDTLNEINREFRDNPGWQYDK